ncbi:phage holin family protein [Nocardioides sp. AE5]|uniref:phage holin family protein n=1 Tax=Nocardioides sp. AE5 TaxID=2962573 RepID=UPI002880ED4A|nr:phage holin family protein [Nocardioides sp. AE5]MDT0203411.1 phage holin family protein [Nocardioides sp. AE5]
MKFIIWVISNAAALAVAVWLLDGLTLEGDTWQEQAVPLILVTLIMCVVSTFVEPVVKLLSLPVIILTIGLFLLVINALMLMLTGWVAGELDLGFAVDGFWWALAGSIIISLVGGAVRVVLDND